MEVLILKDVFKRKKVQHEKGTPNAAGCRFHRLGLPRRVGVSFPRSRCYGRSPRGRNGRNDNRKLTTCDYRILTTLCGW